jgi:hypothetical protein
MHYAVMSVITIRDVPDDVKEALTQDARKQGQSLQAFLLSVMKQQARFSRNLQLLADIERELSDGAGADASAPDSADVLAQVRMKRDEKDLPSKRGAGGAA